MDILENELVRKYFGCNCMGCQSVAGFDSKCMAEKVLSSMQEPIKKHDRILHVSGCESETLTVEEKLADERWDYGPSGFHAYSLRLPDRFQEQECDCLCHRPEDHHAGYQCKCQKKCQYCNGFNFHKHDCSRPDKPTPEPEKKSNPWDTMCSQFEDPKPKDEVEEKIKSLIDLIVVIGKDPSYTRIQRASNGLRELVALARKHV